MIKDILTASGVLHRQGRFPNPPADTYAVYFDDVDGDGADFVAPSPDGLPCVWTHDGRIEVYEPQPDPEAEAAIEAAIKAGGLSWTKYDRVWLQDVQRYQVTYEITYITKT